MSTGATLEPGRVSTFDSLQNSALTGRRKPLLKSQSFLSFPHRNRAGRWIIREGESRTLTCSVKAVLDTVQTDDFSSGVRNPAISTSYRNPNFRKPNLTVWEAHAKVCTGPTQTRPLSEEQAFKVLDTIQRSAKGELQDGEEPVSKGQLGAFFAAMTICANTFPESTQWSEGERFAMNYYWPQLMKWLTPDIIFLADPEGSLMGTRSCVGSQFVGHVPSEMRLVGALREVLAGGHLGYEEVQGVLKDVLPLKFQDPESDSVTDSLLSAFLMGQHINRETDRELKAYCLAFDDELGPAPVADVKSLTHYGEPKDGNTHFLRARCLLQQLGLVTGGITEEQILKFMGANTQLSPFQAKQLLEDAEVGFTYVSQREAHPSLYSLVRLREHIKKRPPLATSEKIQHIVRSRGRESIVAGFYHDSYEEPLLMLMRRRGVHSGLVVKGEEGALSMTTKSRSVNASKGIPVNYCSGFHSLNLSPADAIDGLSLETFKMEVDARNYGFESTDTPRTDRLISRNTELGLAALSGEKGPAYDWIILNTGMVDHLLGCNGAEDITSALDRAGEAIDSGKALKRLLNYIKISNKLK